MKGSFLTTVGKSPKLNMEFTKDFRMLLILKVKFDKKRRKKEGKKYDKLLTLFLIKDR